VARLRGARFVAAVETEEGRRLAEVRVKELTGSDTISARFMRAEWFDFRPVAKLWISTNHRPTVRGTDEAIWRRICLIPFTVTIPVHERDRMLPERLRGELPGILAWAVEGCRAWLSVGLNPPAAVVAATSEYRRDQDVLGQFLADECVLEPACWAAAGDLFRAYREWAEEAAEKHVLTQKTFGTALRERGFADERRGNSRTRGWRGIGLLDTRSHGGADG
jgi:putative DNA primase/helicase